MIYPITYKTYFHRWSGIRWCAGTFVQHGLTRIRERVVAQVQISAVRQREQARVQFRNAVGGEIEFLQSVGPLSGRAADPIVGRTNDLQARWQRVGKFGDLVCDEPQLN